MLSRLQQKIKENIENCLEYLYTVYSTRICQPNPAKHFMQGISWRSLRAMPSSRYSDVDAGGLSLACHASLRLSPVISFQMGKKVGQKVRLNYSVRKVDIGVVSRGRSSVVGRGLERRATSFCLFWLSHQDPQNPTTTLRPASYIQHASYTYHQLYAIIYPLCTSGALNYRARFLPRVAAFL